MHKIMNIVTLHGGCFTGGSASWDQNQTVMFKQLGYTVHQLDFPKDNLQETITFIVNYLRTLPNYILLGRSSGGFLAKYIKDHYSLPGLIKVIYLAPVFAPNIRVTCYPRFKNKQDHFFRNSTIHELDTSADIDDTELLFLATHDQNVPQQCFTKQQLDHAIFLGIKTHKGMTCTTSNAFKAYLV